MIASPRPDMAQAQRFLALLAPRGGFTFQTFGDAQSVPGLVSVQHCPDAGGLREALALLAALNARGAGVFVTVNETTGAGRKAADVRAVRALFVDLDAPDPARDLNAFGLAPSIVVESSPGKHHVYWTVDDRAGDWPLDECAPALKRLAFAFGGDPNVCDLARVLRVPGFVHRKGKPFVSRIVAQGAPHAPDELRAWLSTLPEPTRTPDRARVRLATQRDASDPLDAATPEALAALRSACEYLAAADRGWLDLRADWMRFSHRMRAAGEGAREVWLEFSARSPNHDPEHDPALWDTLKPDRTGYAAIFKDAQAQGWVNPASKAARAACPPAPDRKAAIKRARELLAPAMREREAPAYPVDALGPLADACEAIATHGQAQPALVGQCLLGAASLLTQGLHRVETLAGARPLSLYLLTLGDSGDGKSTAQGPALRPVYEWQREAAKVYAAALADHEKATALLKKGEEPPPVPASPYRLMRDATVEGLRRDLDGGPCSQGIFTDEAAAVLSGYGMTPEHRAKTAGVFSGLWDSGHLSVSRATGPRVERYGRRVALHWLIQPQAAGETLGDPLLSALGFWPRFLAAWPAPQEPRISMPFRPDTLPAVGAYWWRCEELLAQRLGDDADACPVTSLADDARALLGRAFERFEREARRGGLRPVKPFALRAAEQACRVAGVLAAFAGGHCIGADTMRGALALVAYSLETWRAVIDEGAADQGGAHALRLFEWLTLRDGWREKLATIVNAGPACVRSKDKRDAALDRLRELGLVAVADGHAQALLPEGEP